MKIEWVHFPLHPDTPAEGRALADLFAGRNVDREAMHAQMKARMDAEGLPYGERTMTYNSRLAQELGKWADTQPGGDAIHDALFRAYFVEARDISRPAVLLEIVAAGRPPGRRRARGAGEADVQGRRRRGLGALAPVRHHRRADVRRRRLRRRRRAAVRGAGGARAKGGIPWRLRRVGPVSRLETSSAAVSRWFHAGFDRVGRRQDRRSGMGRAAERGVEAQT